MNTGTKRKWDKNMEESKQKDAIDSSKTEKKLICEWCKVEVSNEVSMRQHLLGQKHKKFHDAEEDRRRVEQKCGLYVKGFPPTVSQDDLLAYFSNFGKIVWIHVDHSFLLLDYDESAIAQKVINRVHYIEGRRLLIKYRQMRKQAMRRQPKEENNDDLIKKLKDIPNFDEQVSVLSQSLQPIAHEQFPKYDKVCRDLHIALNNSFPYCRIHPFGSTITGLGFKNSDVDVFISGVNHNGNDIPYLYRTKNLLLSSRLFTNVLVIPQAKIPILKCIHIETDINCDINMKNMLGVCNSQLINYYLNLDHKLRQLMIVLKFWAKTHKITGQNHLFTNYSLNLMLIFFLQHPPFRFPTVLMLQQDLRFFNNQDGWNGGFQPVPYMNTELNRISLLKLLQMFFAFYIDYEYGVNVICPYLGSSVKKQHFKEPGTLPNYYSAYKEYVAATNQFLKVDSAVCIQDPFEHSRNTTPIVSLPTLEVFVAFCRLGKKICEEDESQVLFRLVTEVPPPVPSQITDKSQFSQIVISMRPGMKYLEGKYKTNSEKDKAWFDTVTKFTKVVLKEFFKFEVSDVDVTSKTKHQKTEGQTDVHNEMQIFYHCTGKLNLWNDRKSAGKNKDEVGEAKKGIVEKEIAITEQLCNLYKNIELNDDIIEFDLSLGHVLDPPQVTLAINKIKAYKKSFKSFVTFFSANFPAWFKTYEQELNESANNK